MAAGIWSRKSRTLSFILAYTRTNLLLHDNQPQVHNKNIIYSNFHYFQYWAKFALHSSSYLQVSQCSLRSASSIVHPCARQGDSPYRRQLAQAVQALVVQCHKSPRPGYAGNAVDKRQVFWGRKVLVRTMIWYSTSMSNGCRNLE